MENMPPEKICLAAPCPRKKVSQMTISDADEIWILSSMTGKRWPAASFTRSPRSPRSPHCSPSTVACVVVSSVVHPELRNINLHNITHSLISWNPRERMFVVQISLLIVIFISIISQMLSLMQTIKEVNPHPHIASCVNMWSVTFLFLFLFFFSLCHLLNVVHA